MKISMIAALAHDGFINKENGLTTPPHRRVIGSNNAMPWHLPADFSWFKRCTMGKPVIMGRKTYESIGRPLPGRKNIVITRDPNFSVDGISVATSVDSALTAVHDAEEVMVIGGGSIYEAFLPMAKKLYITYIDADVEGDTHFPDWGNGWQESYRETYKADDKNQYDMEFVILDRQ